MPQFIMTAIASVVFALVEPGKSAIGVHHGTGSSTNGTLSSVAPADNSTAAELYSPLALREDLPVAAGGPNSYAIVFR